MKTKLITSIILSAILTGMLSAQPYGGKFRGNCYTQGAGWDNLNLTESQKTALDELRYEHQTVMIELRAELQKNKLAQRQLLSSADINEDEYLGLIEKESKIKSKMALKRGEHKIAVLSQLTDEQKALWNKSGNNRGLGKRDGNGKGQNRPGRNIMGRQMDCRFN